MPGVHEGPRERLPSCFRSSSWRSPSSGSNVASRDGAPSPCSAIAPTRESPGSGELVATFVLALVFALRDLETAALFYPPGGEPLTVRIFTLEANGPPAVVSALAVLHVLITFAAASVGLVALARRRSR